MVCLTGADPTLLRGGEFARDNVADARDMSSQVFSLTGVPGRSTEVTLGRRDVCLLVIVEAIAGEAGCASALGNGGARVARTWFGRVADDPEACETVVAGVGG